jgi:branched-subunit amino acid transport protein
MWVPIVFLGHQQTNSDFIASPFLIAGVATVIFSLKVKNTLAVVMFGMSIFGALKVLF